MRLGYPLPEAIPEFQSQVVIIIINILPRGYYYY